MVEIFDQDAEEEISEELLAELALEEEEEEYWIKTGHDYLKYMFEENDNFTDLAADLEAVAAYYRKLDKNYKMVEPVDGSHVIFERKDGRPVYEEEGSVLTFAKYEDSDELL